MATENKEILMTDIPVASPYYDQLKTMSMDQADVIMRSGKQTGMACRSDNEGIRNLKL